MKTRRDDDAGAEVKVPADTTTEGPPEATTAEGASPPETEGIVEKSPVKGPIGTPDELAKYYFATSKFNYIGMDSTSILQVTVFDGEPISHINPLNRDAEDWLSLLAEKKIEGKDAIDTAVDVLEQTVTEVNQEINRTARTTTDAVISGGKVLLALKPLVTADAKWVPWLTKNLPFMSPRSIQKYMRLAARTDCHAYSYLGIEALDHLCSVSENFEGDDKISSFLKTYGIEDKPEAEFDLTELKLTIDTGSNCETLVKHGIEFDFEIVKLFTMLGQRCDKALINELLRLKRIGANPTNYLQLLIENKGVTPSFLVEDEGSKQLKDVNSLSSKLVTTIEALVGKHATKLKEVDQEILMKVSDKIKELIEAVSSQDETVTI